MTRSLAVLTLLFVGTAAVLVGCDAAGPASADAVAAGHDGEALLRGVVFGTGPAAEVLPELWGAERPRQPVQAAALEDYIVQALAQDPAFFDRFHAALTSGRPAAIEAALDESGARALKALRMHPDPDVARTAAATAASVEGDAVLVVDGAIWHFQYAYRTMVATYRGLWIYGDRDGGQTLADRPSLEREHLISLLAQRLRLSANAAL